MNPLLLPREPGATSAWFDVVWPAPSPPAPAEILGGPATIQVSGPWTPVPHSLPNAPAFYQRVQATGLAPGARYQFVLSAAGTPVATCSMATLPSTLPPVGSPLMVLTSSCFSLYRDPAGALGRAFLRLPAAYSPHLAVLTGDQVYLDTPISHFLLRFHSPTQLAAEFTANYSATWGQDLPDGGFGKLATGVGAYLSGDDHELWNNAPNVAPHLPDTWSDGGRTIWTELATELFNAYQTPQRLHAIELPPLSVRIVDTRFSRSADRSRFMDAQTLSEIATWLANLSGPAILALGQPVLGQPTGPRGYISDWTLVDYQQYADLVRALSSVQHDVVVITGDVHFGRVAQVQLPNGRRIVEIIASPMILVDDRAGRKWRPPPATFPAFPVPGVVGAPVSVGSLQTFENQFATLALWSEGASVRLDHTCWQIGADGSNPQPVPGYSGRLN